MPKENHRAREVKKTGEIGGAPLVAGDEPARVLEPSEQAFDLPATFVAAKGAAILRQIDAVASMRRDQFDVQRGQRAVQRVAVVGGVPDDPLGVVWKKTGV